MNDNEFERLRQIAKDEFDIAVIRADWNEEEVWRAIRELSDIRAGYNLFDAQEVHKYHALSLAIKALRKIIGT